MASPAYDVAFLLDITGSMIGELDAVKAAAAELVGELKAHGHAAAASIRLITFTESAQGCFVADRRFDCHADALAAIRCVHLATAPNGREATGDDGPENAKAAVLQLLDRQGKGKERPPPTIAFLITDDMPHLRAHGSTRTAVHEAQWLAAKGLDAHVAGDAVRLFRHVVAAFGEGNLVLNCVLFGAAADPLGVGVDVYGQLAAATGGLVMKPKSGMRNSKTLAAGLLHIVLTVLNGPGGGGGGGGATRLDAYDLFDVSRLPVRDAEPAAPAPAPLGDAAELFEIACWRMAEVTGRKWSKRARGIVAGREQLRVVCDACLYVSTLASKDAAARAAARAALSDRISAVAAVAAVAAGPCHFRLTIEDVDAQAAAFATGTGGEGLRDEGLHEGASLVSLVAVREVLEALEGGCGDDDDDADLLARFMSLLSGFSARVDLPPDRDGRPDFMSAWAAAVPAVAPDRITAAEFMRLVGGADGHRGLTDAASPRYNAFLAAPEPGDRCATLAFAFASATQALNWATAVAMGACALGAGYVPNLAPGLLASALVRMSVSATSMSPTGGSEFAKKQAATLASALGSLLRPVGGEEPNPEDEVSKLVAALLSRGCCAQAGWRGALEEWLAAIVQRHHRTTATTPADVSELARVLAGSVDGVDRDDVDPETELHALERGDVGLSPSWSPDAAVAAHPAVATFARAAAFLLAALPQPLGLEDVWPGWSGWPALHLLLLRDRTARYSSSSSSSSSSSGGSSKATTWTRRAASDVKGVAELVVEYHRASKAAELRSIRARREAIVRERLVAAATAALSSDAAEAAEAADDACDAFDAFDAAALKLLTATVMTCTDRLRRSDAPAVLARVAAAAQGGGGSAGLARASLALVLGPWSTEPASVLKKARDAFLAAAASAAPADLERMKAAFGSASACSRKTGTNRHGHSVAVQYPGPVGYTAEYAAHRRAALEAHLASAKPARGKRASASLSRRLEAHLASMARFSAVAAWATSASADLDADARAAVAAALAKYSDANRLSLVLPALEALIGRRAFDADASL